MTTSSTTSTDTSFDRQGFYQNSIGEVQDFIRKLKRFGEPSIRQIHPSLDQYALMVGVPNLHNTIPIPSEKSLEELHTLAHAHEIFLQRMGGDVVADYAHKTLVMATQVDQTLEQIVGTQIIQDNEDVHRFFAALKETAGNLVRKFGAVPTDASPSSTSPRISPTTESSHPASTPSESQLVPASTSNTEAGEKQEPAKKRPRTDGDE